MSTPRILRYPIDGNARGLYELVASRAHRTWEKRQPPKDPDSMAEVLVYARRNGFVVHPAPRTVSGAGW